MQTYTTKQAGSFEIRPLTPKIISAAGAQLRKEGLKIESLDFETSPVASAEIARLCLAGWTATDGTEPLKGLAPKAVRAVLMEDAYMQSFILARAKEQADEREQAFEVVSGN